MTRLAAVVMIGFAAPTLLFHAVTANSDPTLDAVSISPGEFEVLLENDQVRVVEYSIEPGQRDPWHTHPAKVSYVVSGGLLRITTGDGSTFLADEKAGTASWMGAVGWHYAENVGSTPVRIVLVEPKSGAHSSAEPSLVGAWRLVSMTTADASGTAHPLWGEHPSGFLLYTPDGRMAAQVYDPRRPRLDAPWQSATAEAARVAYAGLSTYFGTYTVDHEAHTVTHAVEGAMVPDWIGTRLVRSYRFIDDDHIELRVVSDAQIVVNGLVLVWERLSR